MTKLQNYPWPGNIRELANFIERCNVIFHNLGKEQLVKEIHNLLNKQFEDVLDNNIPEKVIDDNFISTKKINKEIITSVLEKCSGNKTKAADILGISRSTLWRKLNDGLQFV